MLRITLSTTQHNASPAHIAVTSEILNTNPHVNKKYDLLITNKAVNWLLYEHCEETKNSLTWTFHWTANKKEKYIPVTICFILRANWLLLEQENRLWKLSSQHWVCPKMVITIYHFVAICRICVKCMTSILCYNTLREIFMKDAVRDYSIFILLSTDPWLNWAMEIMPEVSRTSVEKEP